MTSKQRSLAALEFREADRVPRFWNYFFDEFVARWQPQFPGADIMRHFGNDMEVVAADETPWPTCAGIIQESGSERIVRNGWGQIQRTRTDAFFSELIEPAVSRRVDPDTLVFDDPRLDSRYARPFDDSRQQELFLFCKTGGPYLRSTFLRSEEQLWIDIMEDPQWTRAFVERVTDHLIAVGVESIRRWNMQDTGIQINDDVAGNHGPMIGPGTYERIFLPPLQRMVKAYKKAGARFVMHHSDGNVMPLLDMWVDAGINVINPVECRAGMDAVKIRQQYAGRLVVTGGLDNTVILPRGDRGEIRDHVLYLLQAARGGGYVIGPHSIGPDISLETMQYVLQLLEEHGQC